MLSILATSPRQEKTIACNLQLGPFVLLFLMLVGLLCLFGCSLACLCSMFPTRKRFFFWGGGGGGVVEMGKTLGEFDTGDILNHFL